MRKLLYVLCFLFCITHSIAQDRQQALTPGIYSLNLLETPLYYLPSTLFKTATYSVMHIKTAPFKTLQEWGTQFAIVSQDTAKGSSTNSIVFLNAHPDTSIEAGFINQQTEPLHFEEISNSMRLMPSFGNNALEYPQNGIFNLQDHWFSVYRHPQITTRLWNDSLGQGKSVWGINYSVEATAFNLYRTAPFKSVIFNNNTDSIPLYIDAGSTISPQNWCRLNENLFVLKDSLNGIWLKISLFELLPGEQRLTGSGAPAQSFRLIEKTGWIRKEDLYRGQWVRHLAELPDYRFEVAGADPNPEDPYYNRGLLAAIKVIDKKNNQIQQVAADIGAELTDSLNRSLHFIDANFDGYPDMMFDFADGGAGPNYINMFYLFDPVLNQFVYDEALSALSQVEVDTVHQLIRSAWRAGAGQHGAAEYRFIGGKLEQTYQWDQVWGAGYFVKETASIRQPNGQWKEIHTYGAEAVADTISIYRTPNEKKAPVAQVPGTCTYFKILDEKPLWYSVQINNPDSLQGWIRKETVFPDNWEPVPTGSPRYAFEKVDDENGNLLALRIKGIKSGAPTQLIGPIDNIYRTNMLETGDYNGDGHMDFRICFGDDKIDPAVYLFEKRSRLFFKAGN
ncbi:hypothetical protein GCM10027051_22200 [Niabella terrae]